MCFYVRKRLEIRNRVNFSRPYIYFMALLVNLKKNLLIVLVIIAWLVPGNVARADDCDEARRWFNKGLDLLDDSKREASCYQKAIELCPDFFEAHNRLGEVYKSWGEYDLAIKEFEQAGKNPLFAEPHNNLGEIYRIQGRYDLAAEEFKEAIRIKPDFGKAQNQLKYVYKRSGKYDSIVRMPGEHRIPVSVFTNIPGMTLPKGKFSVDFQYEYFERKGYPKGHVAHYERKIDVNRWILGIRYGLSNNFTVGLFPKYFLRKAKIHIEHLGIDAEPRVDGFGDTVLMTKYQLWRAERTFISAFHLLSIPTGDDEAEGKSHGVKRRMPLGSGGFDFTPGIATTTVKGPFTIQSNISYTIRTGGLLGDQFNYDFAIVLPLLYNFVSSVELNYRWRDNTSMGQEYQIKLGRPPEERETHKVTISEEAGHTLFLSPGLQFFLTKEFKIEFGAKIPIIKQDDEGAFVEDTIFHVGLMKYFF